MAEVVSRLENFAKLNNIPALTLYSRHGRQMLNWIHTFEDLNRMNVTAKSLGIDKLDVANRLALIGELWDSVSAETETLPLSTQIKAELDSRIAEADANPDLGVSWDQERTDAIARLRK